MLADFSSGYRLAWGTQPPAEDAGFWAALCGGGGGGCVFLLSPLRQPMTAPPSCRAPHSSGAPPASRWNLCSLRQHFSHLFLLNFSPVACSSVLKLSVALKL